AQMRALPDDGWSARGDGSGEPPLIGNWRNAGLVRHGFTHFDLELHLSVYSGGKLDNLRADAGQWWPIDRIEEAGLPTLFAKAARLALAAGED
ncbi:MAG: A/G-specific adenine glycosylase, partial [Sphingomonadales bacterium]